jgi:hypothetical protein
MDTPTGRELASIRAIAPTLRGGASILVYTVLSLAGCSSGSTDAGDQMNPFSVAPPANNGGAGSSGAGTAAPPTGGSGRGEPTAGGGGTGAAGMGPVAGMGPTGGTTATGGSGAGTGGMDAEPGDGLGGMGGTTEPAGPDDGDANAPVVETPDVACGGPGGFGAGANFELGGREMIVTYPCDKHAGAPMIFFLNLHGTTPVNLHFYQHGYFSAHQYAASHNLIVVTPSSVVQQWGNGDGGEDEPHLMEIVDWVYATFHGDGKFDIRAMWVGGHSWGAMYTTTFVCKPYLADKVKGAVIMSGIGSNPACAANISVISTAAEDDIGPVVNQGSVPMTHGCDASQMAKVGNNDETHWPNCDPGFTHANYLMLGKAHADSIDAEVVKRIADLMKAARP